MSQILALTLEALEAYPGWEVSRATLRMRCPSASDVLDTETWELCRELPPLPEACILRARVRGESAADSSSL